MAPSNHPPTLTDAVKRPKTSWGSKSEMLQYVHGQINVPPAEIDAAAREAHFLLINSIITLKQAMTEERDRLDEQILRLDDIQGTAMVMQPNTIRKLEEGIGLKIVQRWSNEEQTKKLRDGW